MIKYKKALNDLPIYINSKQECWIERMDAKRGLVLFVKRTNPSWIQKIYFYDEKLLGEVAQSGRAVG